MRRAGLGAVLAGLVMCGAAAPVAAGETGALPVRARRALTPAGVAVRVDARPAGGRTAEVRWAIVERPPLSRLRRIRSTAASLAFRPDVNGHFVLRATAGRGARARSGRAAVDAGPRAAMVTVDTAVDGPDPAGTHSANANPDVNRRSGIRVGDVVYRAPWMHIGADGVGSSSGTVDFTRYRAEWQVVALDRRNLGLLLNRTYGLCGPDGSAYWCTRGPNGRLVEAFMDEQLQALGPNAIVLASNHATRPTSGGDLEWSGPDGGGGRQLVLPVIGGPKVGPNAAGPGTATIIGVPGLRPGTATWEYRTTARARLNGYLLYDIHRHFGYVPADRRPFDTRWQVNCEATTCRIQQKIGDQEPQGSLPKGQGGYLVAAFNPVSGNTRDAKIFATYSDQAGLMVDRMTMFIQTMAQTGSLITISALETPGQSATLTVRGTTPVASWARLARAVASIGGTRNAFNRAAATHDTEYTLIGWTRAGEGNGYEDSRAGARLRGVLVPQNDSALRPQNVSAYGPPDERLQDLIVRPPQTAWPYDDNAGVRKAIGYLGSQIPQLGPHPRSAYWIQDFTQAQTSNLRDQLGDVDPPPASAGIDPADLQTARRELARELLWVGNTDAYLDRLAAPSGKSGPGAWEDARDVADRLAARLAQLNLDAQTKADWFGVVRLLVGFAGGSIGLHFGSAAANALNLIKVASAALEAGHVVYESTFAGGAPSTAEARSVQADELGDALKAQADSTVRAFERMQFAIVSDPAKLREVGTYAGCNPEGGCPAGMEEYALTPEDLSQATDLTRIAIERSIYTKLVPLSFPVWDTGITRNPSDPAQYFSCSNGADWPFDGPALDVSRSLDELDPTGVANRYEVRLMVARKGETFGYPSDRMLHRMFDPVDLEDPAAGGLGISAADLMRSSPSRYDATGYLCAWFYYDSGGKFHGEPLPQ